MSSRTRHHPLTAVSGCLARTVCCALGWLAVTAAAFHRLAAEDHWAFRTPQRPPLPAVKDAWWLRQPIDAFIAARLDREGLSASPEADPPALVRRASLALVGLPPTPQELEEAKVGGSSLGPPSRARPAVGGPRPDWYERYIDKLLASPRYGERWAAPWLDLARYADTHGYHSDSERVMWPWRDWVIDALNAGMPYDQFTIEQLAGDLLPDATLAQRVATGLHRNHMLSDENGAIPEEYRAEYVADRVATTGAIWLGLTLACARCHDHKYDPITQREYYQLFAFFNNVPENGLGGKTGNSPPMLAAPTRLQQAELAKLEAQIAALKAQLAQRLASADTDVERWERQADGPGVLAARPPTDCIARFPFDESAGFSITDAAHRADRSFTGRVKGNPAWALGRFGGALLCDGETHVDVPGIPNWDRSDAFALSAWIYPTTSDRMTIIGRVDEPQARRGLEFGLAGGRLVLRLTHVAGHDELEVRSQDRLALRKWQHVAAVYDGSGQAAGVSLYLDGQKLPVQLVNDTLSGHIQGDQPLAIGRGDRQTFFRGLLDEVQLFDRTLTSHEVAALAGGNPVQDILALPPHQRSDQQKAALKQYFLESRDPAYQAAVRELSGAEARREVVLRNVPVTMVMQEAPQPRPTFVLERGLFDQPRERVFPGTPAVLPPMRSDLPRNRLGLAWWLTDPQHPLTGRVAVNRLWQELFGAGLVPTPDDFGIRGQKPTHPELLDWLAVEFSGRRSAPTSHEREDRTGRGRAWDVKKLIRQIVTSATYRQSSAVTGELLAIDPDNRLLARGPRFRLPAEMIRDQALAVSGLIDLRIGGPGVRPYQPAELWRELAYDPQEQTAQVFVPSTGADLYRRSLYTFWKRTVPPPNLSLLDAPDREVCTVSRSRTNSPLVALVLLNDTTFVEASRKLAEQVLQAAEDEAARIDRLLTLVLARPAGQAERALLSAQLAADLAEFRADPQAALRLLSVGQSPSDPSLDPAELAAWTMLASTVLNLDETLNLR